MKPENRVAWEIMRDRNDGPARGLCSALVITFIFALVILAVKACL